MADLPGSGSVDSSPDGWRGSRGRPTRRVTGAHLLRATKLLCFGFGAVALTYCGVVMGGAAVYQSRARGALGHLRAQSLTGLGSHSGTAPARGSVLASLENPRIGLSVMVLEGTDEHTLRLGPGHLQGTGLPGKNGNVVIAGHRDTFFRPLRDIQVGDVINLTAAEGTYQYEVIWTRVVEPADTQALKPTRRPVLTLVTCYPFSYVGAAPERLVVRAKRLESESP